MLNFCNNDSTCLLFVSLLLTWACFMVFLSLYNIVSNIIIKHKESLMNIELEDIIKKYENRLVDAIYEDDKSLDTELFIDNLWAELEDLKELRGV